MPRCVVFQRKSKKSNSDTSTASVLNFMSLFLKCGEEFLNKSFKNSLNIVKAASVPHDSFLEITESFLVCFS